MCLWNEELGARAVTVAEHPWLPRDVPYTVYFGMAMLPMAAFLAASMLGAVLTAQEFELGTIVEYRLGARAMALILGARLTRLVLSAFVGSATDARCRREWSPVSGPIPCGWLR